MLGIVFGATGFSKPVVPVGVTPRGGFVAGRAAGGKPLDLSNAVCAAGLRGGLGDAFSSPLRGVELGTGVFSRFGLAGVLDDCLALPAGWFVLAASPGLAGRKPAGVGADVGASFGFEKAELSPKLLGEFSVLRRLLFTSAAVAAVLAARDLFPAIRSDFAVVLLFEEGLSLGLAGTSNPLVGPALGGGASPASPLDLFLDWAD